MDNRPLESKEIRAERELAGEIDGLEVVIPVKMEKGKLSEPVTNNMIRQGLKDLGYKVPLESIKSQIIDDIGSVEVLIVFPSGSESLITVVIEAA